MKIAEIGGILVAISLSTTTLLAKSPIFGTNNNQPTNDELMIDDRSEIVFLRQQISTLNERVDGLTTIIEGLNVTINNLQKEPKESKNLDDLEAKIDKLSAECLPKEVKKSYPDEAKSRLEIEKEPATKSNASTYRESVRLFQQDKFSQAKEGFELTQSRGYKPAASNYYLGEISYYTKSYSDAIFYFKKSAGLYDRASYIDTLLLHTAISLEKTGDRAQAKLFYQTVIDQYPQKKSAKIARRKLNNL